MHLTKASVAKLSLPDGKSDLLVFDDDLAGFGLRLRSGGKRTWIAQYRLGTKQRRLSLGSAAAIDADEARKRAKAALSKVTLGIDPQIEKNGARVQASVTIGSTAETYLSRWAETRLKPNNFAAECRYLRGHWSPLHEVAVQSVTRAMVAARLGQIASTKGPYSANRARAALSAFYSWAIGEGLADANPVVGTNKAIDEESRDRVLTPKELSLVWRLAGEWDYGAIVRLLILTGQRREEVGGMLWSEIDLGAAMWRIASERTKNARPHEVPLSAPALGVLRGLERREGRAFVFGSREGPFQGWSNAKVALDTRMSAELGRAPTPWRLHDIRRTGATRMADLGVQPHVIEAVLNHISGHKAGVAGVYNRATYAAEKRQALDMWGSHVAAAIDKRESNIAPLRSSQ
jgi:integrase